VAPSLLEIAEAPAAYMTARHPKVVVAPGYLFVPLQPKTAAVQRIRLAPDELGPARDEIRRLAGDGGFEAIGWWISELTEPRDAPHLLGLEHAETLAALALTSAPAAGGDAEVREVRTLDDYIVAWEIDAKANGWPVADHASYERMWETVRERFLIWLALIEGDAVGMARCVAGEHALVMIGGAVLPEARGRGVYRSLVGARWRTAQERGIPALIADANDQSAPILRRLGFEELGAIEVWLDRL
jgi:ribosomal protein S18 acetylase RimI-like enzyme